MPPHRHTVRREIAPKCAVGAPLLCTLLRRRASAATRGASRMHLVCCAVPHQVPQASAEARGALCWMNSAEPRHHTSAAQQRSASRHATQAHAHTSNTHTSNAHTQATRKTQHTHSKTSGGRPCASKRRARRRVGPMGGGQRGVWLSVNSTQPLHAAGCAQKCREPTRDGGAISRARRARCGALSASVGLRVGRCPFSCAGGVRCGAPACANAPGPARFCDPSPHVRVTALPCGTGRVARVRGSPLSLAGLSCSSHLATGLKKKKAKQMMP